MASNYDIDADALTEAATAAGHVHRNGNLNINAIAIHAGIDRSVLSRVARGENGPDLHTVVALASAYNRSVEGLIVRRRTPRAPRDRRTERASAPMERAA